MDKSLSNEWGRLAQGNDRVIQGAETIEFIHQNQVAHDKSLTHAAYVCYCRPSKEESNRIRLLLGGDCLPHEDIAGSPASDLL